jgi:hypothetical protein
MAGEVRGKIYEAITLKVETILFINYNLNSVERTFELCFI